MTDDLSRDMAARAERGTPRGDAAVLDAARDTAVRGPATDNAGRRALAIAAAVALFTTGIAVGARAHG